jgi:hypothetical protein
MNMNMGGAGGKQGNNMVKYIACTYEKDTMKLMKM